VAYVRELVDRHNAEGEKVIIVDEFRDTVSQYFAHYGDRAVLRMGGQDINAQLADVKRFQRDPLPGVADGVDNFIGTTGTCMYGLTLTAARVLYMVTLAWTPAECDQVFDRAHRISQTRPVLIFLPVLEDTVDEYVYEKLEIKRAQVLHVIDNQEYAGDMKTSIFADVLRYLRREK
jgi:SNF2 family DNA or RNA helicase